jgi:hypothetical protein
MTDAEKRRQNADLLLHYKETRQRLSALQMKAQSLANVLKHVVVSLENSPEYVDVPSAAVAEALDDAIVSLASEVARTHKRLKELADLRSSLGILGSDPPSS